MANSYPTPNAIDQEAANISSIPDVTIPAPDPLRSEVTGVNLVPELRFDGSTIVIPWNRAESDIFNWLTGVNIEIIEERVASGINGVFWARGYWPDGQIQSLLLNFASLGKEYIINNLSKELCIEIETDLLCKQIAAYEAIKALGAEDLGLPLALRDIDTVGLLSDAVRDEISKTLKVADNDVDDRLGISASLQLVPPDMDNFAERWSSLGLNDEERWYNSSSQIRYSIYRAYLIDFIIGTQQRSCAGFGYNTNTDKLIMLDNMTCFSHIGFLTDKYISDRSLGWAQSSDSDDVPSTEYEFNSIFAKLDDKYMDEFILTANQMVDRMNDELVGELVLVLLGNDIPLECVAGMVMRLGYLASSPGSVIKRPIEFIRNVCMPIRTNMTLVDDRMQALVDYTNDIMTTALGEHYDVMDVLTEQAEVAND